MVLAYLYLERIIHLPNGKWQVVSKSGKPMGTYSTKAEALARLRQIERIKHAKGIK